MTIMTRRVLECVAIASASFGAAPAATQLPSNSLPVFIADERLLIGRYRYVERDDGMKIAVDLNADHTAIYRITEGKENDEFIVAKGYWTLADDTIHIHNKPGPVRLDVAAPPTRDPAVPLSVTAKNVDGTPADGLGVTWRDADGLFVMTGGRHVSSKNVRIGQPQAYVMRLGDRKILQTLDLKGGMNSFRFTYHPSDEEPFDIPAIALDAKATVIEVEVGTSYARLTKTPA